MTAARTWRVEVPGWVPRSLNQLLGNRHRAARLKAKDARTIAHACAIHGVPPVGLAADEKKDRKALNVSLHLPGDPTPVPRLIGLEVRLAKAERAHDEDNYFKSLMDGLKGCGMLFEDNRQWARHDSTILFTRGTDQFDRGAVIVISDLEGS